MKNNFWLMLVAIVSALALVTTACGDDEEALACEEEGGVYECTDDATGDICEDTEDPECSCVCLFENNPNNVNNSNTCTEDADCAGDLLCVSGACVAGNNPTPQLRFVMIEDLQDPVSGDYPGSDIDSVELCKAAGGCFGAETVEDYVNMTEAGNLALDPTAVLGAPDSGCDAANDGNFYAMGGLESYVILGYGNNIIEAGDQIDVYELGSTECGRYDDDSFAIGVSVSTSTLDFVEIQQCTGSCLATVPAL